MKPASIVFLIVIGMAAFGTIAWIGQTKVLTPQPDKVPTVEDLQIPKLGPFGVAEINETSFDFGSRLVDSEDEHVFTIKNTGEGPLILKLGKPTCQCTGAEILKNAEKTNGETVKSDSIKTGEEVTLASNESASIPVKWVMKTVNENFLQRVPIFTTDPNRRQIDLEIKGNIDSAVYLFPGGIWDAGEITGTEPKKISGYAFSTVWDDFKIIEEPRKNSPVTVTWERTDARSQEMKGARAVYMITASIDPKSNVPVGQFRETIQLMMQKTKPASQNESSEADNAQKTDPDAKDTEQSPSHQNDSASANSKPENDQNKSKIEAERLSLHSISLVARRTGPIEIRGVTGARFSTVSNRLIFDDFNSSDGKTAKMLFFPQGMTEELQLLSVEPADSPVKITLEKGKVFGNSISYQVQVVIPPGVTGKYRSEQAQALNLKLNHPEVPDLRLLIDYNAKN